MKKITLSSVIQKHLTIVGYLLASGLLGLGAAYIVDKPELSLVLTPVINYIMYAVKKELDNEGVLKAVK